MFSGRMNRCIKVNKNITRSAFVEATDIFLQVRHLYIILDGDRFYRFDFLRATVLKVNQRNLSCSVKKVTGNYKRNWNEKCVSEGHL